MTKKALRLLALAGLYIFPLGSALAANTAQPNQTNIAVDQEQRFGMPADKLHGQPDIFNKWAPVSFARVEFTVSVATVVASGSGVVDGVCMSSGTVGDYAVFYDTTGVYAAGAASASVGNYSALQGTSQSGASLGWINTIRTFPYAASTSSVDGDNNQGCTEFATPLPFSNGLYVQMYAAGSKIAIRYRLLRRTGG